MSLYNIDIFQSTKVLCILDMPNNQIEFVNIYGIIQQTMNKYIRMANIILSVPFLFEIFLIYGMTSEKIAVVHKF